MAIFKGIGVGSGKASGKIKFLTSFAKTQGDVSLFLGEKSEKERFYLARDKVVDNLERLYNKTLREIGKKEAEIFNIHKMLLLDDDYPEMIEYEIESGKSAYLAIESATEKYVNILINLNDEYLSARSNDIKDLASQLENELLDTKKQAILDTTPYILVANDLTPSQTASLDKSLILGIVTSYGSISSHTSILAKAMGIPAIVGVGEINESCNGEIGLLDAKDGTFNIGPTRDEIIKFESEKREENKLKKEHDEYLRSIINRPAITKNGHRVLIYANIGGEYELESALENGAEGIGLLRSELMYLTLDRYPTEEELFDSYRKIAIKLQGKRVVIRTLDAGADKQIPYLNIEKEENPALGFRGVRVCLENKEMFKTQIRAILRASAHGNIALMLPMIISPNEVIEAKRLIEECKHELFNENLEFNSKIEVGIMIETPSSAIMARELSSLVDFFSVGTNDLTQYTLAVDRQNPKVAHLCDENYEPILRLIEHCANEIHKNGGWIGICGELGANLSLTEKFIEMEIDELSVSPPYLLGVREKVSQC